MEYFQNFKLIVSFFFLSLIQISAGDTRLKITLALKTMRGFEECYEYTVSVDVDEISSYPTVDSLGIPSKPFLIHFLEFKLAGKVAPLLTPEAAFGLLVIEQRAISLKMY